MKRIISLLLSAALLLVLLPACQEPTAQSGPPERQPAALEVVNAILPVSGYNDQSGDLEYLTAEEGGAEFLSAYLDNAYGLSEGAWKDAAVIRATGASAFELAVLRLENEEEAVRAAAALMTYIFNRQGDFAGYAPEQVDLVANGGIAQDGPYAALCICPNPDRATTVFSAAVNGNVQIKPGQPNTLPEVEASVGTILDFLMEQCGDVPSDLERLDSGDPELLASYIGSVYGLSSDDWEEAVIVRGIKNSAFEIAVLRVKNADTAWDVAIALTEYLDNREEESADLPDQFNLLHNAAVSMMNGRTIGSYVILPVCENAMALVLEELSMALLPDSIGYVNRGTTWMPTGSEPEPEYDPDHPNRYKFVPPNKDDMSIYDTSDIRAAWENGDPSSLSSDDRAVYNAAKKVLGRILKNGMSDLEKETAVYNWIVNNVDYDWTHQDVMRETPRESFAPYGGLVNHAAVCLGYATTFQLLMDLSGVECITVTGAAFASREDHGWNMVRLDGNWYCVDVTWDANYREQRVTRGRERDWVYFNITSDKMAATDHQWDYANTPEAVTEGNGRS